MSWDCCNLRGECQQGPGCPARALFDKPAKPADGVHTVDLRRVQLLGKPKPEAQRGILAAVLVAALKGAVAAFALVGLIFTATLVIDVAVPAAKAVKVVA
jgi:hypothetical protein